MNDDNGLVIDARDVQRTYGAGGRNEYRAVRGVTLQVRRGEVFALLGANGAGKTSIVELLEGLAPADGGTVRVLGHDPYRERTLVRPLTGVMLQSGGFPADLTVTEVARFWARCARPGRTVSEVLSLVGLQSRQSVPVKQLSGGEHRRLDLALAVMGRPEVLFLDEPTTGMDPEGRRDTWEIVQQLRQEGVTVLLTTHYLEEAEGIADRVAILQDGVVVAEGTTADVIADHPSRVSFELPADCSEALPAMPGVTRREVHGRTVVLHTQYLQPVLTKLLVWANRHGVVLQGLDARSATLEDAFLAMTPTGQSRSVKVGS
ncbi:ABC transporter ATP-binding protein [Streptomyces sp. NBC_00190]|uniref:ABC transporter ATP-binding protein n=1 Tax=unclassified Streptomyces TaxID=2593676 RepID=UPI002E2E7347|nr:ABC transporter ATP-binding protein [Streptomyces sp. NBC_00190]WSZ39104.1 ABC transporter ATP-binding protein [Streptomyces sp. NBC_00868]